MIPRYSKWLWWAAWALWAGGAAAEPQLAPGTAEIEARQPSTEPADAAESPGDVHQWVERETTSDLFQRAADHDRQALLAHGWQDRAPTWIQAGATVNLADFPTLDDASGKAERDIKTLEWVLEEQRRKSAGQASQQPDRQAGPPDSEADRSVRDLIPRELVASIKANRDWVAAGGTALLVVVWATAAFARRPGAPPRVAKAPEPPRRRRRRRSTRPAEPAEERTRPMSMTETGRTRY